VTDEVTIDGCSRRALLRGPAAIGTNPLADVKVALRGDAIVPAQPFKIP
jgi:hypothetical protein